MTMLRYNIKENAKSVEYHAIYSLLTRKITNRLPTCQH